MFGGTHGEVLDCRGGGFLTITQKSFINTIIMSFSSKNIKIYFRNRHNLKNICQIITNLMLLYSQRFETKDEVTRYFATGR